MDPKRVLLWLLIAFFFVGGAVNIFAPGSILADYERRGYPGWFHFVTGTIELTAASASCFVAVRRWGMALAAFVMAAATVTLLAHAEYSHAVLPLVIFLLTLITSGGRGCWNARQACSARSPQRPSRRST